MGRDFRNLMIGRFLFTFAVQMQAVILGWRMYDLTRDPLFLGLVGLAEAVPALGLALYAGYIVDRSHPLRVYRRVIWGSLLSGLIMLISQLPAMEWSDQAQITGLFVASFVTGAARGFSQPAMFAIVPRLVPRTVLPRASAWMASAMQIARISGPALGGFIFGWAGMLVSGEIVCGVLLTALGCIAVVRLDLPARIETGARKPMKEELLSGARFVWGHPILLPALSLDMISVLFGGVTALLPIYASDILKVGPKGLGLLRAAPAVGAAVTSLWLTRKDIRERAGTWLMTSVTGFGLCILVFALSRDLTLSMIALGLSGAFDSVSMVIRGAAVQLASPDSMRGRISAVNSIFIGSSNELGEFESGVLARWLGTVPAAVIGGILCLTTVGAVAWRFPALRRLDLRKLEEESRGP